MMRGRMMEKPLLVSSLIEHAGCVHGTREIVGRTATGGTHRSTWAEVRGRAKRLAGALEARGIAGGERIGTLGGSSLKRSEPTWTPST